MTYRDMYDHGTVSSAILILQTADAQSSVALFNVQTPDLIRLTTFLPRFDALPMWCGVQRMCPVVHCWQLMEWCVVH